ncbi:DUF5675 family protein [Arcicella sp. LKC2W]|uniref:DUF5675 family protein n=1 Tax=Arcicella sp. LKC2W TaxID=2984198 RepID=UPI002B1F0F82|nr:DUF5675 family protein [Arcicella sp. LKC2W]MEA5459102.1 DUF5675 family protein [Arcicella sp. LKC2W]
MEITVNRFLKTQESTISTVLIDGVLFSYGLEDVDRGLTDSMPVDEIKKKKVFGKTAIPSGRYRISISFSNRFKRYLPEVHNVKGFEGIRIHSGNTAQDTEGCLLLGTQYKNNTVINSRLAFDKLMAKLLIAETKEEIWITYKS